MKNLFKNIWEAPAATAAAALIAALGAVNAAEIAINPWVNLTVSVIAAFLALFSGPNPKK